MSTNVIKGSLFSWHMKPGFSLNVKFCICLQPDCRFWKCKNRRPSSFHLISSKEFGPTSPPHWAWTHHGHPMMPSSPFSGSTFTAPHQAWHKNCSCLSFSALQSFIFLEATLSVWSFFESGSENVFRIPFTCHLSPVNCNPYLCGQGQWSHLSVTPRDLVHNNLVLIQKIIPTNLWWNFRSVTKKFACQGTFDSFGNVTH